MLPMAFIRLVAVGIFLLLLCTSSSAQIALDAQFPLQTDLNSVSNLTASCQQACTSLQSIFRQAVHRPSLADLVGQYYAVQNEELVPQCVVQPETAEQVSQIITILKELECIFAVKSGGHSMNPGSSSIDNGVLIDLSRMNSLQLAEDESTVSIGPGARWGDVYLALEERGLLAVGGRVSSVGVGGLTLGGGISFLSRLYGMACDNVRNFELVLANGTIVNVNQKARPDLYYALRGGGNNFGIVTRFDLETYRHGPIWGGTSVFAVEDLEDIKASAGIHDKFRWNFQSVIIRLISILQSGISRLGFGAKSRDIIHAFTNLAREDREDSYVHAYIFFAWIPELRAYLSGTTMAYTRPEVNPSALKELTSIKKLYTTNRVRNMSDFAAEVEKINPVRVRHVWDSVTFKLDAVLISRLWEIFLFEIESIKEIPGTLPACTQQMFPKDMIARFSKNGGNSLGIVVDDGPLFLFSVTIAYKNRDDDEKMKLVSERIMNRAVTLGQELGLHHPFLYQNYAAPGRNIFAGYGLESKERLLQIQQKYDPDGVFSRLQPGHFKLEMNVLG